MGWLVGRRARRCGYRVAGAASGAADAGRSAAVRGSAPARRVGRAMTRDVGPVLDVVLVVALLALAVLLLA